MAYLLDTGILLRLVDKQDRLHDVVRIALGTLGNQGTQLWIAAQNVAEFLNVATRPVANNGLAMAPVRAVELFEREIESICSVLEDTDATHLQFKQLVTKYSIVGKQVHDARLVAMMLNWRIESILTLNDRHFRRYESEGITVVTPANLNASGAP